MYYLSGKSFRLRLCGSSTLSANSAGAAYGPCTCMGLHGPQLNYGYARPQLTGSSRQVTRSQVDNAQVRDGLAEPLGSQSNLTHVSVFFGSRACRASRDSVPVA